MSSRPLPTLVDLHCMMRGKDETNQKKTLRLYFGTNDTIEDTVSRFSVALRREGNYLAPWHPKHPNKPYLQFGDYVAEDKRPKTTLAATNTFSGFEEYLTILGYATIIESEQQQLLAETMSEVKLKCQLIDVPDAHKTRYFGLLQLPDEGMVRLEPGDSIKVNFNPELNLETEDWTALITTALPFAAFGDVSFVLFRPFDKETNKHVDLELSSLPYTFKTVNVVFQALQSHPITVVYMIISTSRKVLKLQLSSLRELQDKTRSCKTLSFPFGPNHDT